MRDVGRVEAATVDRDAHKDSRCRVPVVRCNAPRSEGGTHRLQRGSALAWTVSRACLDRALFALPLHNQPIGVFDSGIGGLTVLKAIHDCLPDESTLYLGDTARVPYGTRSPETVERYAVQLAALLLEQGVKALVVACNTATTHALPALQRLAEPLGVPVVGVVDPGVGVALQTSRTGRLAVLATEGTVRGEAYPRAVAARSSRASVAQVACPLFVALAEVGWTDDEVAHAVARRYLAPLADSGADTLILGCTHFPLLRGVIAAALPDIALVDASHATATALAGLLDSTGLRRKDAAPPQRRYLVTDNLERFTTVGARFLGAPPTPAEVVDLGPGPQVVPPGAQPS